MRISLKNHRVVLRLSAADAAALNQTAGHTVNSVSASIEMGGKALVVRPAPDAFKIQRMAGKDECHLSFGLGRLVLQEGIDAASLVLDAVEMKTDLIAGALVALLPAEMLPTEAPKATYLSGTIADIKGGVSKKTGRKWASLQLVSMDGEDVRRIDCVVFGRALNFIDGKKAGERIRAGGQFETSEYKGKTQERFSVRWVGEPAKEKAKAKAKP